MCFKGVERRVTVNSCQKSAGREPENIFVKAAVFQNNGRRYLRGRAGEPPEQYAEFSRRIFTDVARGIAGIDERKK